MLEIFTVTIALFELVRAFVRNAWVEYDFPIAFDIFLLLMFSANVALIFLG